MRDLPDSLERVGRNHVLWRGRRLVFFGGCDYLRLARDSALHRAAAKCLRHHGLNLAASRKTTGNHPLYDELERVLCRHFSAATATLVSSGSVTNLCVAQAFAGEFTHVLVDERSHPCLADVAPFFGGRIVRFAHRDPRAVAQIVQRLKRSARLIILTDGMFAHSGHVAPLREYLRVLPRMARILVDDAHGAGVVGKTGQGSLEHEGVDRRRIIQCITLSKAFGAYGGAILGDRALRSRLLGSRMFIGSTPPPLPVAAAALEGIRRAFAQPELRRRLERNSRFVRSEFARAGLPLSDCAGPIVTVTPDSPKEARRIQRALRQRGVLPPFIQYPGGPTGGCFRFVISSAHTRSELRAVAGVFA